MRIENAKIRMPENKTEKVEKKARVSSYSEDFRGEYYKLPTEKLLPFKNQARRDFDNESLKEMAQTIEKHGIRQPLTVLPSPTQEGFYEVVSGERRLRAAKLIGMKLVPCIIIHDPMQAEELAIIENIQRKDLHPVELAVAYNNMLKNGICKSTQEVADKLSVNKSAVVETLALIKLSEEVQNFLIINKIKTRSILRELQKIPASEQIAFLNKHLQQRDKVELENNNKSENIEKAKSLPKDLILSIAVKENHIQVIRNKLVGLSEMQKEELKDLLNQIIECI